MPEIKALMDQGREYESKGQFQERDIVFGKILDIGERVINDALAKVEGAKITLDRTVGNFFSHSEPTFAATLEVPVEKRYEAITAIVNSAESLSQENVHISEITPMSDEVVLGEEMEDGSINEPNVDIRFDQPLTDFEIKALEKITQKEAGFAGFTINPDKKGINLYNISKFESYDKFFEKLGKVKEILDRKGVSYTSQESVRRLFNYGNPEYGATRTYQQVRDQNAGQKVAPPLHRSPQNKTNALL